MHSEGIRGGGGQMSKRIRRDEEGGVAAEYAAVTAFIAGAVVIAVNSFGGRVVGLIELL